MGLHDYIKDIARFGLENDQTKLLSTLNDFITHNKNSKKVNFALQLETLLRESDRRKRQEPLLKVGSPSHYQQLNDRETDELILEKLKSDYTLANLICTTQNKNKLQSFLEEHHRSFILKKYQLPISNKLILHGPSGCGKTLASYVIAGELDKTMIVVNLGAIVSSKLGETSKNLAKVFQKASNENSIIFFDEFDSLGKVRDYNQDHGEMKRVVNTILQLLDYLPQDSMVICATNQKDMVDEALLRRFDLSISLDLPGQNQIEELIDLILKEEQFAFSNKISLGEIIKIAVGLSYYSIQKSLIGAIKQSLLSMNETEVSIPIIDTEVWHDLLINEKEALSIP
ncbi:AAA family ATPase [Chryseobacterium sp. A321]